MRLVLKRSYDFFVFSVVEEMICGIFREVEQLRVACHVCIDVFCLYL